MKSKVLCLVILLALLMSFISCSGADGGSGYYSYASMLAENETFMSGEAYNQITENPFYYTSKVSQSYFSMDSNTASYANLRRYLENNQELNADVIKTDELINYFDYSYPHPTNGDTFLATAEISDAPWNTSHKLLTVAVGAKEVNLLANQGRNYVFLIDVSGSMDEENKLPLVKSALNLLVDQLSYNDTVSIVTYASGVKTVADGWDGSSRSRLKSAISNLKAGGATAGADGLDRAYALAEKHKISGGNNRLIIFSDGDFNVGTSSQEGIEALVTKKRESGIYLTCLGFGMGNYHDTTMETISKNGNGGYYYIDSILEAEKVLVTDLNKTMVTVAKDTKAQMTFNPETVESYRLIGYENKQLTEAEFNDETQDAGEIGSGSTSVVCYELVLKKDAAAEDNLFTLNLHYKNPQTDASETFSAAETLASLDRPTTDDHRFVTALVGFSLLLRNSPYRGQITYTQVENLLKDAGDFTNDKLKTEFASLLKNAKQKNVISNPDYANYCTVTVCTDRCCIYYSHKRGETLTVADLTTALNGGSENGYRYTFYYDMAFTEPYQSKKVDTTLSLFVKAEPIQ